MGEAGRGRETIPPRIKQRIKVLKKDFDRGVKAEKKKFWQAQQDELYHLCKPNSPDFWKELGKTGVDNRIKKVSHERSFVKMALYLIIIMML